MTNYRPFYKTILESFSELKTLHGYDESQDLVLFNNKDILVGGRPVYFHERFKRGVVFISDLTIKRVDHTKSLGLTTDGQLPWSKRVDETCKKASSAIGALKRVRPFIPKEVAVQIYNALILPHSDSAARFGIV